jgi:hypothetical protein
MSNLTGPVPVRPVPDIGMWIPGFVLRAALGVVAALLCLDRLPPGFWLVVGLLLTGGAVAVPRWLTAWGLLVLLGASQVLQAPSPHDGHFFLLLAGLHLIQVLAAHALAFPWRSRVQLAVLRRPLLRFVAIQGPVQVFAAAALAVLAPHPNGSTSIHLPVLGIVGGAALVVVTLLLVVPLLRE